MPRPRKQIGTATIPPAFDAQAFLNAPGITKKIATYRPLSTLFSQGDPSDSVIYIQKGAIRLSVLSHASGRRRSSRSLGPGDFVRRGRPGGVSAFQHGNGDGGGRRASCADRAENSRSMVRLLHQQPELADRFLQHMLARNIRIEEDLVDQLFNSSEKRLARTLLLLARYGTRTRLRGSCQSCLRRRWQRWWAPRGPA